MPYARRVILHAPSWKAPSLADFVEECIRDGVVLVCVVGEDCQQVEDVIDELVVGDGSEASRFVVTTSHPNESIGDVRDFAANWKLDGEVEDPVQEVRLA